MSGPEPATAVAVTQLPDGWTLALILTAISLLVHEPWRWVGMFLGRNLDINSDLFRWVRSVSTALVAALVMRLLVFPAGALQSVSIGVRALAVVAGLGLFFASGRRLAVGVLGAAGVLVALRLMQG
ncbi:MAG TPA: AzlD domain-containing protein [Hyphomicrobiaceae bacterium]|nr:AzlD domain-containing protein [Hyphomicrobiaceae bacterium]